MDKKSFSLICAIVTSVLWGSAFVAQDMGMDFIGPHTFNVGRFLIGFLTLVPFFFIFEFKNINLKKIDKIKNVKGRGLMLGLEFDFEVAELRKKLIYDHRIFTGGSSNKKLIRILPPLTIKKEHIDIFFKALKIELKKH
jgi:hypothetical protein